MTEIKNITTKDVQMARALRIEFRGVYYHITTRGNERKNIFKTDKDRE
jgi:REP element-mobilizing transposase RayT